MIPSDFSKLSNPDYAKPGPEYSSNITPSMFVNIIVCRIYYNITTFRQLQADSYEDLEQFELNHTFPAKMLDAERTAESRRRSSMRHLIRQTSIIETQKDYDGSIKLTYWF